jgi:hypothetical protein
MISFSGSLKIFLLVGCCDMRRASKSRRRFERRQTRFTLNSMRPNRKFQPSLVLYEQMAAAVAKCVAVDEAAQLRSRAAQLEAYARIPDDRETQTKFAELRLRATQRIGELCREMEKATNQHAVHNGVHSKAVQLAAAGLDERTARRYEQLSGPREDQAKRIVAQATNSYFANARLESRLPLTAAFVVIVALHLTHIRL